MSSTTDSPDEVVKSFHSGLGRNAFAISPRVEEGHAPTEPSFTKETVAESGLKAEIGFVSDPHALNVSALARSVKEIAMLRARWLFIFPLFPVLVIVSLSRGMTVPFVKKGSTCLCMR